MEQSLNPADTRDIVGLVQKSSIEDVDRAVEAAKQAKKAWRKLSGAERASLIKAGMEIMGLHVKNTARPPIVPVEKEHCRQLENILKNAMARYPKTTAAL
ncbi:aldehyde dehydrogenase family protein [Bacillus licheniformis]|nr:aldehyde dehydrogenase family protein [Bacillus licheniformis]